MKKVILLAALTLAVSTPLSAREKDRNLIRNAGYYSKTEISKYDWDEPAAKYLVLDDLHGKVTKKEFAGFKKYLLNYQLPVHNSMNYYFRKRMNSYAMEWVYERDNDIQLVNKAIEVARRAVAYRNDNIHKQDKKFDSYQISHNRSIAPIWPNYKEAEQYSDGSIGLCPGASGFAGLASVSVPVRMIANDKSIWNKKYNGQTYKEIALELADEALKTIDYTYSAMVGEDKLIRYPETMLRTDRHGMVFIYNRVFPVMSGAIPLVEAFETFGIKADKVKEIDQVNQAMIDYLKADITYFTKNSKECMHYPYSEASKITAAKEGKVQAEDFTHGSFDSRDFQLFYLSGRYNWTEREVNAMANTLVEVLATQTPGSFKDRLHGEGKTKKYGTSISYDGYMWYATYRPEIYDVIISAAIDKGIMQKNGVYDAYMIYEILKLKDIASKK